ncbi:glycoside hydrolase family 26 protein [Kitasatospora sp. NBC_01302]|uniref:glycoside hydrolase family 26 protein n=1 Tax=Kitasatospora sp. NBC_01302 TaxID=2903575 RepID=UPI002E138F70|nr:glycosyl hydrolase [Kitasatospora sp. NBC_01302]
MRIGRLALAASALLLLTTAGLGAGGAPLTAADRWPGGDQAAGPGARPRSAAPRPSTRRASHEVAFGAFVGSWDNYIPQIARLSSWLDGANLQVGHTYLAGNSWADVEGDAKVLALWSQWRMSDQGRTLVLNVPMLVPNEGDLPDDQVAELLNQGAHGAFDQHFLRLARRLVALGGNDTVIVLGWEMNGITYTSRCGPDPAAWKAYWRRIIGVMRSVPGQKFRFDFTPNRGLDAIAWTKCYPGDDVVDVIGTDSYDQPAGATFDDYVHEPYGLEDQVEFAARRGKPVSYPEWGLFRNGDNPEFVRRMVDWMRTHDTLYQTVTDYCPHGFWQCRSNPRSSAVYRELLSGSKGAPVPTEPPCRLPGLGALPNRPGLRPPLFSRGCSGQGQPAGAGSPATSAAPSASTSPTALPTGLPTALPTGPSGSATPTDAATSASPSPSPSATAAPAPSAAPSPSAGTAATPSAKPSTTPSRPAAPSSTPPAISGWRSLDG